MVKELEACKDRLAQFEALGMRLPTDPEDGPAFATNNATAPVANMAGQQSFLGPNEAAASRSLIDLSQGYREMPPMNYPSITPGTTGKVLGGITLTDRELEDLYVMRQSIAISVFVC
jgi:hypothetical protein